MIDAEAVKKKKEAWRGPITTEINYFYALLLVQHNNHKERNHIITSLRQHILIQHESQPGKCKAEKRKLSIFDQEIRVRMTTKG